MGVQLKKADYEKALCSSDDVDTELFFSDFDEDQEVAQEKVDKAKGICSVCPVRMTCLQSALDQNEDYGVWGGRDETVLRRARFVDVSGRPLKDRASIICPNCQDETHKDLYVIENFGAKTDVGCHSCGLMWTAKKNIDPDRPSWSS